MKATIDERGTLTVSAETPLEAWALRAWSDRYQKPAEPQWSATTLLIVAQVEELPR